MKKITLLTCLLGINFVLFAQPIIQKNTLLTGFTFDLHLISNPDPLMLQSSGANVNWDISNYTHTKVAQLSFVNPANTPYASSYPTANFGIKYVIGTNTSYSLFSLKDSIFELLANQLGAPNSENYIASRTTLKFPLSFTNTFSDSYQKVGQNIKILSSTYDAFGDVKTPEALQANIARVMEINGDGDTSYLWWKVDGNKLYPVLQAGTDGVYWWKATNLTSVESINSNFYSLTYPNPASTNINFDLPLGAKQLNIFDSNGKLIYSIHNLNEGLAKLDISKWQNGFYYCHIINNQDQTFTQKFVKN